VIDERWTQRSGLRFAHRLHRHPSPRFTPTLFVSGAFQTMDSWARFTHRFAASTTVLLVDPPGMGRSDPLPPDVGIDFLAECLEQVLDEHGVERATIVAASYGTPSAFELARRRPERVDRLMLCGTMSRLPPHRVERITYTIELARRREREALADEVVSGMLCHDPQRSIVRRETSARVLRAGVLRMSDFDLDKYMANTERLLRHPPLDVHAGIDGPEVLAFTGEHDVFTPPEENRRVASAFARAWFTTVGNADHLFHLQRAETVCDLLLRFASRALPASGVSGSGRIEPVRALPS
jgi:pimeloyl-ACP methyl ester carboxylesterase